MVVWKRYAFPHTTWERGKGITYDTFGNILSDSNPSFIVPFGFAGGESRKAKANCFAFIGSHGDAVMRTK